MNIATGRTVNTGIAEITALQKENRLPDLQPTVRPFNKDSNSVDKSFQVSTHFEEDNSMSGGTTLARKAKVSQDGKSVKLDKTEWHKTLDLIKNYKVNLDQLVKDNKKLSKENTTLNVHVGHLDALIEEMKQERGSKSRKSSTSNNRKDEQKEDVEKAIIEFVKNVLFRTTKFARPGPELARATKAVWEGIKDKLKLEVGASPLDLANFTEIYDSCVLSALSGRRQYIQTRCLEAAKGA